MKFSKIIFLFSAILLASCGPSKEEGTPARDLEDRDQAKQIYSRLEGVYVGTVTPSAGNRRPIPIEMELRMFEVRDGVDENNEPRYRRELRGFFHPTEIDLGYFPGGRPSIGGRFYPETNELALQGLEVGGKTSVSISAVVTGDSLEGPVTYNIVRPVSGTLRAKRASR